MKNLFDNLIGSIFRPLKDKSYSISNSFLRAPYEITRRIANSIQNFFK